MSPKPRVFEYRNYKDFVRSVTRSRRGAQSDLARHIGCQAAYLYQVLNGKAELTEDQAYKVTTFLDFRRGERDYFMSLVRLSKASTSELRTFLKSEIDRLQDEELHLKNKADSEKPKDDDELWNYYFSDSLISLIHILTSSDKYRTAESIAKRLHVSNSKVVLEHLKNLSTYGLVKQEGKRWLFSSPSMHLPKDARHNLTLQLMRRSQVMNSILTQDAESTHFTSLFTLDLATYQKLRMEISEFVHRSQKLIHQGGSDEAYVLCLDLFSP
jgi:uncharacterized protein (TIGR02147 family)